MGESSGARAKEILFEALEHPAEQREALVATRCGSDEQLRQIVLALLRATPTGEASPLDMTRGRLIAAAGAASSQGPGSAPNYELLGPIGEGGFGVVYLARQLEPVQRQVALKVIKPGMDSKAVLRRFEAERQALAVMDHPHIAKVFDAGVTDRGLPFFAMEHVRGEPITAFCDEHRLSLHERLAVFVQVCEAVQHAHTKAIIHRDIKPSNILVSMDVDGHPSAKVIDFGVAKALDQGASVRTLFTEHGQIVGTPEYMSPEQAGASGQDIDTRSDVYSLGVVLYELLTGLLPFDPKTLREAGFGEIQRIIRDSDPPRPSTRLSAVGDAAAELTKPRRTDPRSLTSVLRGELDWVVMKCLEKDRSRRYETPSALAADIARYLVNEPVAARPPTTGYRLRKFIRRNRAAVLAASVLSCVLVAATWISVSFAIDADRARRAEAQRAKDLQAVADFQADQLGAIDPEVMGIGLRQSLIEAAPVETQPQLTEALSSINFTDIALLVLQKNIFEQTIQAIDTQFADQPLVQAQLLQSVASVSVEVGLLDFAVDPQERALGLRLEHVGDLHPDTLASFDAMGGLLIELGELAEAEPFVLASLEGRRRVLSDDHPDTLTSISNMGYLLDMRGRLDEAEPYYREALEGSRRVLGDDHPDTLTSIGNMGGLLFIQGRLDEAEPYYREALEGRRRALGDDHPSTLTSINNMAALLDAQGRLNEAEPYYREALKGRRRVLGDDHPKTLTSINNMGFLLKAQGRLDEAEPYYREALEGRRRSLGDDHPSTLTSIGNMGSLLKSQGRLDEAEPYYREALEGSRRVLGHDHPDTLTSISNMGYLLKAQGRLDEAEPYDREALEGRRRVLGDDHPDALASLNNMGGFFIAQDRLDEAEPYFREALEGRRRVLGDDHPDTLTSISNMGYLLKAQGRLDEAEPYYREALEGSRRVLGDDHPDTLTNVINMGYLLNAQGKHQQAIELLAPAEPVARDAFTDGNSETLATFLTALGRAQVGLGKIHERFVLAEKCLVEAHLIVAHTRGETHKDTVVIVNDLVDLYIHWDAAEPGAGYDAKAAEWRAKLLLPPSSEDDQESK